jgi:hypothetical protein
MGNTGFCRFSYKYNMLEKLTLDAEFHLQKPWEERSPVDRRSESDIRRGTCEINVIKYKGSERRRPKDRRQEGERRDGWLRNKRWSSVQVFDR